MIKDNVNHVVIYSGGMDSFTLLHWIRDICLHKMLWAAEISTHTLHALSFDYKQRHRVELKYAERVTKGLGIRHTMLDLSLLHGVARGSALTDNIPVPHGHYAAENMKLTVVPGRNTVMLAMALAYAEGLSPRDSACIYYGAHAGDHTIYPDCRPEFIASMMRTISAASNGRVVLRAPFMDIDKAAILRRGLSMNLDYTDTWSCYEGGRTALGLWTPLPCGRCGACVERAEAFAINHTADPALTKATP